MLLERMLAEGWVGRVQSDVTTRSKWGKRARETHDNWVLLANVNKLRLADVYRLFVFSGTADDAAKALDLDQLSPMTLDTSALARQVEAAVENGLGQTLAEHFALGTVVKA
jgi:membrane protein